MNYNQNLEFAEPATDDEIFVLQFLNDFLEYDRNHRRWLVPSSRQMVSNPTVDWRYKIIRIFFWNYPFNKIAEMDQVRWYKAACLAVTLWEEKDFELPSEGIFYAPIRLESIRAVEQQIREYKVNARLQSKQ